MKEIFRKIAEATNNKLYDPEHKGGIWMVAAIEMPETLTQWEESSQTWSEKTPVKKGSLAGFPFLAWENTQAQTGMVRQAISVIDLGPIRIVFPGTDLTVF